MPYPSFACLPELVSLLNIVQNAAPDIDQFYVRIHPVKDAHIKWTYERPETDASAAKEKLWMLKIDR